MIDMNKEYVTKGEGLPVRIYCTDGCGDYPVHGAYYRFGKWCLTSWPESGSLGNRGLERYDLIEKPQTITRWVNVYESGFGIGGVHSSREFADAACGVLRIGVLRIEYTGDKYDVFKEDV